jgi:hypothetical protein
MSRFTFAIEDAHIVRYGSREFLCEYYLMCLKRDVRLGLGYCVSLDAVRNFQEAISTPLPADIYPDKMDSSAVIWGDEMRTFWYYFGNGAVVKHIYTCNEDVLQEEPTQLFEEFQLHVELSRKFSKGSVPGKAFPSPFSSLLVMCSNKSPNFQNLISPMWLALHATVTRQQRLGRIFRNALNRHANFYRIADAIMASVKISPSIIWLLLPGFPLARKRSV